MIYACVFCHSSLYISMVEPFPNHARSDIQIIQDLVHYAGSRFRLIILVMKKIQNDLQKEQEWMVKGLHQELVCNILDYHLKCFWMVWFKHFVLIFLGHATSIGLQIDIPMLIRSLAKKLLSDNTNFLSFVLSSEILMALDCDCEKNTTTSLNWWDHSNVRPIPYWLNT